MSQLATVTNVLHDALGEVVRILTSLSVLDWILVGIAFAVAGWGWARALAFARLGAIQIKDLVTDDDTLQPIAAKAELQEQFVQRGLVPPSGVPSGSPTVASVGAAIAAAPIPQAAWIGALVGLLPTPPTSTGFEVTGTLRTSDEPGKKYGLTYQLVCTGPHGSVNFGHEWNDDWAAVLEAASKAIYRQIGEAAPEIYPRWTRWASSTALTMYRSGLEIEHPGGEEALEPQSATGRYRDAYAYHREASELDPDNMLARLRAANCLERIAADLEGPARVATQFEALLEYMTIRVRHPTIFEAGFRASVLLVGLAEDAEEILDHHAKDLALLRELLERAMIRDRTTAGWFVLLFFFRPKPFRAKVTLDEPSSSAALEKMLDHAARRESTLAQLRLRPFYLMANEGRFRHRFEPTGQERRQLRKAIGISKIAIRARRGRRRSGRKEPVSIVSQLYWIGLAWRYMLGRGHVAGWQAHYNAACLYALLPLAEESSGRRRSRLIRSRALTHLRIAIEQAPSGALQLIYVRNDDQDLESLRKWSNDDFQRTVRRLCPDELTVRYQRADSGGEWGLEVSGEGVETIWSAPAQSLPLRPVSFTPSEAIYRIKIIDELKPLTVIARHGDEEDLPWNLVPAALDTSQVWVYPRNRCVYRRPRPSVPAVSDSKAALPVHRINADVYGRMLASGALDGVPVELLQGMLCETGPPNQAHALMVERLAEHLAGAGGRLCVQRPLRVSSDSWPEPDLAVLDGEPSADADPCPILLVVEIAVTSHDVDRGVKPHVYAAAEVPVYWLVDVPGRSIEVRTGPATDGYDSVEVYGSGDTVLPPSPGIGALEVASLLG